MYAMFSFCYEWISTTINMQLLMQLVVRAVVIVNHIIAQLCHTMMASEVDRQITSANPCGTLVVASGSVSFFRMPMKEHSLPFNKEQAMWEWRHFVDR